MGVGRTFQVAQTFVSMSVAENVQMALICRDAAARASCGRPPGALHRDEALAACSTRRHGGRRPTGP